MFFSFLGKIKDVGSTAGSVGGAVEGVKTTMSNIDRLVWYAQLFLIGVSIIIVILFSVWLIRLISKKKSSRR
jgi:hypothetical protein